MTNYINVNEVLENLIGEVAMTEIDNLCRETLHIANVGGDMKEGMMKDHYRKIMIMQLELLRDLLTSPLDNSIKELKSLVDNTSDEISDDEIRIIGE